MMGRRKTAAATPSSFPSIVCCSMANKQKRAEAAQQRHDHERSHAALQQLATRGAGDRPPHPQARDGDAGSGKEAEAAAGGDSEVEAAAPRRGSDSGAGLRVAAGADAPLAASASAALLPLRRATQRRASATPGVTRPLQRSATAAGSLGAPPPHADPAAEPWHGRSALSVLGAISRSERSGAGAALSRPMLVGAREVNASSMPHDLDASIARVARSHAGRLGRSRASVLPAIGPAPRVLGANRLVGEPTDATVGALSAVVHNAVGGDAEEALKIIEGATMQGRGGGRRPGSSVRGSGGKAAEAGGGPGSPGAAEGGAGALRVDRPLATVSAERCSTKRLVNLSSTRGPLSFPPLPCSDRPRPLVRGHPSHPGRRAPRRDARPPRTPLRGPPRGVHALPARHHRRRGGCGGARC